MKAHDKLNILWICTDQQRWDTLGCYGNKQVRTPHIDRLATEGILFENAYCQSPVCTPSRASLLTGRYPRTTGCRQNGQSIPASETLVTRLLADAGYSCGLSGKLHISACHPSAAPITERRIDDGYAEFHWSHHPDPDWPTNEYTQWLRQKNTSFKRDTHKDSKYVERGMPASLHQTTWCAEKAIGFIETNAHFDHPWLFSVNIFDPHHPFDPPQQYLDRYLDKLDDIPLPSYTKGELNNKPEFQATDHQGAYGGEAGLPFDAMTDRDHRLVRAAYWAMCDLIDDRVGAMLDALERTGQRNNTLVIFMSDHGEMLGDHGIYLKGPYFYEPAIHVPLILSWPGRLPAGRRISSFIELTDLAPTLLDAANLPQFPAMQGHSLWSMLTSPELRAHTRKDIYCEYYNAMPWHKAPKAYGTMLRTERYKIVAAHGISTGELYDLKNDPGETHNLWDDSGHCAIKSCLLSRLCDRMAWTVDPMPPRTAPY
jgi:arylsulfatase A-like enzyme